MCLYVNIYRIISFFDLSVYLPAFYRCICDIFLKIYETVDSVHLHLMNSMILVQTYCVIVSTFLFELVKFASYKISLCDW